MIIQTELIELPREVNTGTLVETVQAIVADNKGLLAMDESTSTCNKRFAAVGITQTAESRRAYRELLITTPGLADSISGVILYDETIRQATKDGTPFLEDIKDAGIIAGIKVDTGTENLEGHRGEKVTRGLEGLRDRLKEYAQMGARFTKWRAVFSLGTGFQAWGALWPTRRRSPAMRHCARKPVWCLLLNLKL